MFYIYRITNIINNKIYIGQTNNPSLRWSQHKHNARYCKDTQIITRAMTKHGISNFIFEVIATCKTLEDVNFIETEVIKQYNSRDLTIGYNVAEGGSNELHTPQIRKKISESLKNHYSLHPSKSKGRKLSSEWKKKLSEAAMGKPGTNKGKKFSEEWKRKMSVSNAGKERKHKRKFSDNVEKEICKLYVENKLTIYKIAKMYNCYRSLISDLLHRNKIEKRESNYSKNAYRKYRFTSEQEKEICNMYLEKKLCRASIGKKYGCNTNVVTAILIRNKII